MGITAGAEEDFYQAQKTALQVGEIVCEVFRIKQPVYTGKGSEVYICSGMKDTSYQSKNVALKVPTHEGDERVTRSRANHREIEKLKGIHGARICLLYTSPSPRDS